MLGGGLCEADADADVDALSIRRSAWACSCWCWWRRGESGSWKGFWIMAATPMSSSRGGRAGAGAGAGLGLGLAWSFFEAEAVGMSGKTRPLVLLFVLLVREVVVDVGLVLTADSSGMESLSAIFRLALLVLPLVFHGRLPPKMRLPRMEKEILLKSSSSKKLPQGMLVEMVGDAGPALPGPWLAPRLLECREWLGRLGELGVVVAVIVVVVVVVAGVAGVAGVWIGLVCLHE